MSENEQGKVFFLLVAQPLLSDRVGQEKTELSS